MVTVRQHHTVSRLHHTLHLAWRQQATTWSQSDNTTQSPVFIIHFTLPGDNKPQYGRSQTTPHSLPSSSYTSPCLATTSHNMVTVRQHHTVSRLHHTLHLAWRQQATTWSQSDNTTQSPIFIIHLTLPGDNKPQHGHSQTTPHSLPSSSYTSPCLATTSHNMVTVRQHHTVSHLHHTPHLAWRQQATTWSQSDNITQSPVFIIHFTLPGDNKPQHGHSQTTPHSLPSSSYTSPCLATTSHNMVTVRQHHTVSRLHHTLHLAWRQQATTWSQSDNITQSPVFIIHFTLPGDNKPFSTLTSSVSDSNTIHHYNIIKQYITLVLI